MKLIVTMLSYLYWPLLYITVYMSWMAPRFDENLPTPTWIVWLMLCLGFASILVVHGATHSQGAALLNAFGIALSLLVFILVLGSFNLPGFRKPEAAGFSPELLVAGLFVGAVAAVLEEAGYLAARSKRRRSTVTTP